MDDWPDATMGQELKLWWSDMTPPAWATLGSLIGAVTALGALAVTLVALTPTVLLGVGATLLGVGWLARRVR